MGRSNREGGLAMRNRGGNEKRAEGFGWQSLRVRPTFKVSSCKKRALARSMTIEPLCVLSILCTSRGECV